MGNGQNVPVLLDENGEPKVFNLNFDFQEHDWVQTNENFHAEIICSGLHCSTGHRHGHSIPSDQVLTGSRGTWKLIHYNEEREMRRRNK